MARVPKRKIGRSEGFIRRRSLLVFDMASFNAAVIYIIIHILVVVLALDDSKTGNVTRSNDAGKNTTDGTAMKKGSHLRMYKTSSGVILTRKENETSRTARDIDVVSPQVDVLEYPKRGQTELSRDLIHETNGVPYGVNELPMQLSYKQVLNDYPSKIESDPGERYYYNDFGAYSKDSPPKTDQIWKFNDISDPRYIRFQTDQHFHRRPLPFIERNSCKQYLEFLRYAFEQLDNSAKKFPNDHRDDYYYYDDDYSQGESRMLNGKAYGSKPPPVIYPDLGKLRSLAYNDNYGTESSYSYVRNGYITESDGKPPKMPETNKRILQSTLVPVASDIATPSMRSLLVTAFNVRASGSEETSTELTTAYEEKTHPVTDISRVLITTVNEQRPVYRVGIENTTSHIEEAEEDKHDGCQDKLFSCPDNVNVTYPVNGYCNRFVVCESGKPNSEFCQEGLHFNLVTSQCDLPHNSFCTYSCPREKGYFGIPGVCGGFFRCSDWYPEYRMCPPRMHWDLKAKICTFQELSSCPLKCDEPYQVKPYNGDCSSYIICTRGKPRYHRCPDGMNFDRKLLKCTTKSESNCIDDEDYVTRNRGIENGRKKLCAKIELKQGKSRWCQETSEDYK